MRVHGFTSTNAFLSDGLACNTGSCALVANQELHILTLDGTRVRSIPITRLIGSTTIAALPEGLLLLKTTATSSRPIGNKLSVVD